MRRLCCIWLCCLLILVSGCQDRKVIEELALIDTVSADKADQGEEGGTGLLLIGVSIPQVDPEVKEATETLFTTSKTFKEARMYLSTQTSRMLVSGQVRNILFGSELAREGIWKHLDTLIRDPIIGQRVKLAVVQGSAAKLVKTKYPQHPVVGNYVGRLLEKQAYTSALPEVNISNFARDYLDDGIDPVVPVIVHRGQHISIGGIALFKDDCYVTKLAPEKALVFSMLRDKVRQGELSVDMSKENEKEILQLSSVASKRKVKVKRTHPTIPQFAVEIQVELWGTLREYIGPLALEDATDQQKLHGKIEQFIQKEAKSVIRQMQRHQVDSIGIGQYVRNSMSYQEWKKLDWHSVYPQVPIHVNVRAKIKDFGKFQ